MGGMLEFIFVGDNMFDGPVPWSLKTCKSLSQLDFGGNQLTGDIALHFGVYTTRNTPL
jgi:hypothetical protein